MAEPNVPKSPLPGVSALAFEELKKMKVIDALKFDEKVRLDAQLSMEEFIKEQEEFAQFIQQQLNDKTKADKEAAQDAAAQKTQSEKSLQTQNTQNLALIALLKEINDIEKRMDSNEKVLVQAYKQSQGILQRITQRVVNAVGNLLSPNDRKELQEAYAEQEQRTNSLQYTKLLEQSITEAHETFKDLSKDKKQVAVTKLAQSLESRDIMMKAVIANRFLFLDFKRSFYRLLAEKENKEGKVKFDANYQRDKADIQLSGSEKEQRYNEIQREERQALEAINSSYKEDVRNLLAAYNLQSSALSSSTTHIMASLENAPERTELLNTKRVIVESVIEKNDIQTALQGLKQRYGSGVSKTTDSQTPSVTDENESTPSTPRAGFR
jgi:hypothetical protein